MEVAHNPLPQRRLCRRFARRTHRPTKTPPSRRRGRWTFRVTFAGERSDRDTEVEFFGKLARRILVLGHKFSRQRQTQLRQHVEHRRRIACKLVADDVASRRPTHKFLVFTLSQTDDRLVPCHPVDRYVYRGRMTGQGRRGCIQRAFYRQDLETADPACHIDASLHSQRFADLRRQHSRDQNGGKTTGVNGDLRIVKLVEDVVNAGRGARNDLARTRRLVRYPQQFDRHVLGHLRQMHAIAVDQSCGITRRCAVVIGLARQAG